MRAMSAAAAVVHARVQLRARGAAKLRATHIRGVAVRARAVPLRVRCGPQPDLESDGTLDFPQEWLKPGPSRRPDIFPEFTPIKPPLPQPMPGDPEEPEEDEDEEGEGDPENPDEQEPPPEEE